MSRISDMRLLVFAAAALVVLALVAVLIAPPPEAPPLSVRSADRDGALALELWLRRSGYAVQEVVAADQLDEVDVLFVLEPLRLTVSQDDAWTLRRWVEAGHVLIVAGTPWSANTLLEPFDLALTFLPESESSLAPNAPSLVSPPFDSADVEAVAAISTEREDAVPHLSSGSNPVLVSVDQAAGRVWVSGALRPFTNQGLNDPGNARLLANLLARLPETAIIGFDERVHGYGLASQQSLGGWLWTTAPGWGILIAVVVTFLYLLLRGRRFGRAVPLPDERLRRESVEYIHAMATLFRRSGQRSEILKHYADQFRRRLADRYALDPRLADAAFIARVIQRDPALDANALRQLMRDLARTDINEAELVRIAAESDDFLRSLP